MRNRGSQAANDYRFFSVIQLGFQLARPIQLHDHLIK